MKKINKKNNIGIVSKDNLRKTVAGISVLALSISPFVLTSCEGTPQEVNIEGSDVIDRDDNTDNICKGVTQIRDVEGEDFKLKIYYTCGSDEWHITDTKRLYMKINTVGLPENLEVYIDNIHTDTTIVSTNDYNNGVLQDTMDDRIHNSQMIGFPVSDDVSYFGINEIEGQNETFIEGYSHTFDGYGHGQITERRHSEAEYIYAGVWGNKIESVIDLIIVDKKTQEPIRAVSVDSTLIVKIDDAYVNVVSGVKTLALMPNKKKI
ncbi:MAG: hypothetical protein IKZ96_03950 [Bacilli bacterium]|nr:hypothetical protein [Bacilli bacterium]